jgi:phosphoribosylcarboxyaminoimidazole (NCAIR) mutase
VTHAHVADLDIFVRVQATLLRTRLLTEKSRDLATRLEHQNTQQRAELEAMKTDAANQRRRWLVPG